MTDPSTPNSAASGPSGTRAEPAGPPGPPGPPGLSELPITFRPAVTRAVLLGAGGALFVVLTALAFALPGLGPAQQIGFLVTALLFGAVPTLLSRPKVVADDAGVTVVNIISGRRLAWAEIVQVTLRAGDPWVFLNLSDGTSLPALGIQPGIARHRALADARALRDLVAAHTPADQDPHPPERI